MRVFGTFWHVCCSIVRKLIVEYLAFLVRIAFTKTYCTHITRTAP